MKYCARKVARGTITDYDIYKIWDIKWFDSSFIHKKTTAGATAGAVVQSPGAWVSSPGAWWKGKRNWLTPKCQCQNAQGRSKKLTDPRRSVQKLTDPERSVQNWRTPKGRSKNWRTPKGRSKNWLIPTGRSKNWRIPKRRLKKLTDPESSVEKLMDRERRSNDSLSQKAFYERLCGRWIILTDPLGSITLFWPIFRVWLIFLTNFGVVFYPNPFLPRKNEHPIRLLIVHVEGRE